MERGAVAARGFRDQLRRLSRREAIQTVGADVDEKVIAVGVPERPFGEHESRGEAFGLGGYQDIGEIVGGGHESVSSSVWEWTTLKRPTAARKLPAP